MKRNRRVVACVALILAAVISQACTDDQLKSIATNVDRVATLIKDGREIKDELVAQNLISQDEGVEVSKGLLKVNSALKAFNTQAKAYAAAGEISPAGKTDLKNLAIGISAAASELINNGTFGVKNADAQVRINSVIGSLKQITLAIVDTVSVIKTKGGK